MRSLRSSKHDPRSVPSQKLAEVPPQRPRSANSPLGLARVLERPSGAPGAPYRTTSPTAVRNAG